MLIRVKNFWESLWYSPLFSAYDLCLKPCIDLTFTTSMEKFISDEIVGTCTNGGIIMMQFMKTFELEIVSDKDSKWNKS